MHGLIFFETVRGPLKIRDEGKEDHGHSQQIKLNDFNVSLWDKRKKILNPRFQSRSWSKYIAFLHHFHYPAAPPPPRTKDSPWWNVSLVFCEISHVCPRLAAFTYPHSRHIHTNKNKTRQDISTRQDIHFIQPTLLGKAYKKTQNVWLTRWFQKLQHGACLHCRTHNEDMGICHV